MSIRRAYAIINEQLDLRVYFRYDDTGELFDPYEIQRVEILNNDSTTILETITSGINKLSQGYYQIITSSSWNTIPRLIYDKWYYRKESGSNLEIGVEHTYIFSQAPTPGAGPTNLCKVYGYIYNIQGNPVNKALVIANILGDSPTLNESLEAGFGVNSIKVLTNDLGYFEIDLLQNIDIRLMIPIMGYDEKVHIPTDSLVNFILLTES